MPHKIRLLDVLDSMLPTQNVGFLTSQVFTATDTEWQILHVRADFCRAMWLSLQSLLPRGILPPDLRAEPHPLAPLSLS